MEINGSTIEENRYRRRFLERPDGEASDEISYSSEEPAELDLQQMDLLGDGEDRPPIRGRLRGQG